MRAAPRARVQGVRAWLHRALKHSSLSPQGHARVAREACSWNHRCCQPKCGHGMNRRDRERSRTGSFPAALSRACDWPGVLTTHLDYSMILPEDPAGHVHGTSQSNARRPAPRRAATWDCQPARRGVALGTHKQRFTDLCWESGGGRPRGAALHRLCACMLPKRFAAQSGVGSGRGGPLAHRLRARAIRG